MGSPTERDVHVDAMLTNISVAYIQSQDGFIASKVFPLVKVSKQSDKFYKYTKEDWFKDEAEIRADSAESAGSGYRLGTDSYATDLWAFHKDVGDRVRSNADSQINLDTDAVRFVTQRMLLRQEIQWVSDYFTTGKWATDKTGGTHFNKWSDYLDSDPVEDIATAVEYVLSTTGYKPNTAVFGYKTMRKLRNHPDIRARYQYTTPGNITAQMIAAVLELDNVYVASAVKSTNVIGATVVMGFTHGDSAWVGYVNPSPGLLVPSAGYIFSWDGVSGGLGQSIGVTSFRMQNLKADRFEAEAAWDNKVVASDLGYFFYNAV